MAIVNYCPIVYWYNIINTLNWVGSTFVRFPNPTKWPSVIIYKPYKTNLMPKNPTKFTNSGLQTLCVIFWCCNMTDRLQNWHGYVFWYSLHVRDIWISIKGLFQIVLYSEKTLQTCKWIIYKNPTKLTSGKKPYKTVQSLQKWGCHQFIPIVINRY